jgi:hypothetical protein
MQIQSCRFKFLSAALAVMLAVTPELFAQQGNGQSPSQPQQQTDQAAPSGAQSPSGTQQAPAGGTTVNPSQPPLAPVTTYPSASENQQDQSTSASTDQANPPAAPQPKQQPNQPVGAATAERVPTAGGAAAKPAGAAIAPAKQHQTRSLLIKIGAIAAAGAAIGTVYALSRSSPSTPPNSGAGVPK